MDYKRLIWEGHHYRFGLAGQATSRALVAGARLTRSAPSRDIAGGFSLSTNRPLASTTFNVPMCRRMFSFAPVMLTAYRWSIALWIT
jgi:hypothetical protein